MSATFVSSSFVHASNGDEHVSICGRLVVYVVSYNKIVSVSFAVRSMLCFSVLLFLLLSGVLLELFVRFCLCVLVLIITLKGSNPFVSGVMYSLYTDVVSCRGSTSDIQSVLLVSSMLLVLCVCLMRFSLSLWTCLCLFGSPCVVWSLVGEGSWGFVFGWVLTRVSSCRLSRENPGIQ